MDERDPVLDHLLFRGFDVVFRDIHSPAGVQDDKHLEAEIHGVNGGIEHAVIGGQTGEEQLSDTQAFEITVQAGAGVLVVFQKRRVGIDAGIRAFADHQVHGPKIEVRVKVRAGGALYAMGGPEDLGDSA